MSDVTSRAWWRWMPGMAWVALRKAPLDHVRNRIPDTFVRADLYPGAQPVEDDPATLGCLTQRARELWGDPKLYTQPSDLPAPWLVWAGSEDLFARSGMVPLGMGDTEWAALVAACDAASGRGA